VEGDSQEPALGRAVDRQVEHGALHDAVDDPLNLARCLLEHEHVVGSDEGHADRLVET
jgi:hypothetical protein